MKTLALILGTLVCLVGCEPETCDDCGEGGGPDVEPAGAGGFSFPSCPPSECPLNDPVAGKAACNDNDPYTADRCVTRLSCGGGFCRHTPVECDVADSPSIQAVVCNDGESCTTDRCDIDNTCMYLSAADNTVCPFGTCQSGVCTD